MTSAIGRVAFGGPDLPYRQLRDLLEAEVDAVPPEGRIDFATYYFRDRALAAALLRAAERGVEVNIVIEAAPRQRRANEDVRALFAGAPLRSFRVRRWWPGRLHAKLYAFSHPGRVWTGSFNPSGDDPEDAAMIEKIGDQDRGDNILVELVDARLVSDLRRLISGLCNASPLSARFSPQLPKTMRAKDVTLFTFPRLRTTPLEDSIDALRSGDLVKGAVSHLKRGSLTWSLKAAAKRGVGIELLLHGTERRVPRKMLADLSAAGVAVQRVGDGKDAPMHAKMVLTENRAGRVVWTGSHNFNPRSRFLNAELLLRSESRHLADTVEERLGEIAARE
ncbi:MAG: phospholipase D-like domain-containing protein [Pacificimonas sp.]